MDLLKELNEQQKQAVLSAEGPLLVIAGAGTGKTKVITHRISYLIKNGIEPNRILAVTFTNKAADEMKSRISRLAATDHLPQIGTFHAIAAKILREYGELLGIPSSFLISDEKKSLRIVQSAIEELKFDLRQFQPQAIKSLISQKKSKLKNFKTSSEETSGFFPENFRAIWEKYEKYLKKKKALDFDDLIVKTVLLFENFPEILKKYQEKWPYIHADEYQDTDYAQSHLIGLLAGTRQNICAVGDEDQAIYGFRGADFRNILNFEKRWPGTKIITLERNYRSSQKILEAANAVIEKNTERRKKNLFTEEKIGVKLTAFESKSEKEEANLIAKMIKQLLQKNSSPIAILCRANFQFLPFEEAFRQNFLPYQSASEQDELIKGKQPVQLMTVHAAKGLEFKNVFIPGLEKGLFPHFGGEKEEERRLFYVGLTRAQEKIFLSFSRFRAAFGSKQINQPSQFLSDIPRNLIKWL